MSDDWTAMSHEFSGVCFCGVDHEINPIKWIRNLEETLDADRI